MKEPSAIEKVLKYLNESTAKWATSSTLIEKLNLHQEYDQASLDEMLNQYFISSDSPKIRFSTLPSVKSLNVLWGSVDRIGERNVTSIYRKDIPRKIRIFNEQGHKNMFLSYSFKDSEVVLELAKKLETYGLYAWIAEVEIDEQSHINNSVIDAIRAMPFFGVFISKNSRCSSWAAKEIEFAMNQQKPMFGFLYTQGFESVCKEFYNSNEVEYLSIRDRIFREFFVGSRNVNFLKFPDNEFLASDSGLQNAFQIMSWDQLKVNLG